MEKFSNSRFLGRRCVSWCASTPPAMPSPAATSVSKGGSPHLVGPSPVNLLQVSPPDRERGETILTHQLHQATSPHTNHQRGVACSHLCRWNEDNSFSEEWDIGDGEEGHRKIVDTERVNKDLPEDKNLHLPRSSPVISRHSRASSWQGGGGTADATSSDSSVSADPPCSGQQKLTEEQRGQGQDGCGGPLTAVQHSTDRLRCSSILDFSAVVFQRSCELEKENTHFIMVDMVLEVLEAVKWTLSSNRCSSPSTGSWIPCKEAGNYREKLQKKSQSVRSTDSNLEDCGVDATLKQRDSVCSAESLAQRLVLDFKKCWLPSSKPRRGRQSLRSSLQEISGTGGVAAAASSNSLYEEIRMRTRMRGSLKWAPPRLQIIFTLQPTHRRSEVVSAQHFLCAGCGTEVEPRYIKKLRYCDYLGRYFCDCCHSGSEAVIPARVLSCWDFSRHPVSDFSKQLLDSLWYQPVFDQSHVSRKLLGRVKELRMFQELQEQLVGVKKLLRTCRLSESVLAELEHFPLHLMVVPPLFSMDDLLKVKKGQLGLQVREMLDVALLHIENCELCLARGFICEFCKENNVIFPFQSHICKRCSVCRTCFHKQCFGEKKCPKCTRTQSRKQCPEGFMQSPF